MIKFSKARTRVLYFKLQAISNQDEADLDEDLDADDFSNNPDYVVRAAVSARIAYYIESAAILKSEVVEGDKTWPKNSPITVYINPGKALLVHLINKSQYNYVRLITYGDNNFAIHADTDLEYAIHADIMHVLKAMQHPIANMKPRYCWTIDAQHRANPRLIPYTLGNLHVGIWGPDGSGFLEYKDFPSSLKRIIPPPILAENPEDDVVEASLKQVVVTANSHIDTYRASYRPERELGQYDTRFFTKRDDPLLDEEGKALAVKDLMIPNKNLNSWIMDLPGVKQPDTLYRGMSYKEYEAFLATGIIKSNGSYNIGHAQKGLTYFSTSPASAGTYANAFAPKEHKPTFDRAAYIVAIKCPKKSDIVKVDGTAEHEMGVNRAVTANEVTAVYRGRVVKYGLDEATLHWEKINPRLPSHTTIAAAEIPNLKGMTARELQHYVEANYPVKLWLDDCGHLTELSLIVVDRAQRMTGVGSKAMTLLTQWADTNQTLLAVTPTRGMDNARTGVARLLGFYKRFGFTENKGRKRDFSTRSTMIRLPVARKIVG